MEERTETNLEDAWCTRNKPRNKTQLILVKNARTFKQKRDKPRFHQIKANTEKNALKLLIAREHRKLVGPKSPPDFTLILRMSLWAGSGPDFRANLFTCCLPCKPVYVRVLRPNNIIPLREMS